MQRKLSICFSKVLLCSNIQLPTPLDLDFSFTIPEGSQPNEILSFPNLGFMNPYTGIRNNLEIKLDVTLPKSISQTQ